MGQSELRDRQSDLLVRRSQLQRELDRRKKFDVGIIYVDDEPTMPQALRTIENDLRVVENELTDIEAAFSTGPHPASQKGKLKGAVQDWAEREVKQIDTLIEQEKRVFMSCVSPTRFELVLEA